MSEMKIGDNIFTEKNMTTYNVVLDSGSSMAFLPSKEYKAFMNEIQKNKECEFSEEKGLWFC